SWLTAAKKIIRTSSTSPAGQTRSPENHMPMGQFPVPISHIGNGNWAMAHWHIWFLKYVFQRELYNPRIICLQESPEIRIVDGIQPGARRIQVHVIRQIKRLGSELHALPFPNFEIPRQAHIDLNEARAENRVCTEW